VAFGIAMVACGCDRTGDVLPGDIRSYRAAKVAMPAPTASAVPPAAPQQADGRPALRYDVPEGWSDGGAGGLRLASLVIGDPARKHEVTVIPASGSLEGNVARWAGQLDEQADEQKRLLAAREAIAAGETIDVDGSEATVVLLLDAAAAAGDDGGVAILGAMIPMDDSSALFVKFKGPATVARRERDHFVRFVSSLRWK
jgi:hypothetical protein